MVTADLYHLGKVMPFRWASSLSGGGVPWLVFGGVVRGGKGWQVAIDHLEDGIYEITLTGLQGDELFIRYRPVDEFDERMFLIFLRHIWTPEDTPARPFLRQEWLAEAFDTHQELISRWLGYRRKADWRRLMSRRHGPLMSLDQIQQIINVWACSFWWSVGEVQAQLARQGTEYSHHQIEEAGRLSGFLQVRRRLRERFHLGAEAVKPRDGWLVQRLFDQISTLLNKVEMGEGLTFEEGLEIGILQAQRKDLGLAEGTEPEKPLPWLYQVQHVLFGWWEDVEDDSIRCIYCGSTQVAGKSRKPRPVLSLSKGTRSITTEKANCERWRCTVTIARTRSAHARPSPTFRQDWCPTLATRWRCTSWRYRAMPGGGVPIGWWGKRWGSLLPLPIAG